MNTVRLNITLPISVNEQMTNFAEELGEKKSHIITSALDRYFDYLDLKVAEKRLAQDDGQRYTLDEVFEELGV